MIRKTKPLQILCLLLILWSILGGLLLPLSPAIEWSETKVIQDTLIIRCTLPKLKEPVTDFYLKVMDTAKQYHYVPAWSKTMASDTYTAVFQNPASFQNTEINQSIDLVAATNSYGYLYSFGVHYSDTNQLTSAFLPSLVLEKKEVASRFSFPNRPILEESIRNLFFHVPMWFCMIALLAYSLITAILYLATGKNKYDIQSSTAAEVGLYFGTLGILTGMVWAKFTWGAFWTDDAKLNGAAIGMLSYIAYFILRGSVDDEIKKAKLSSVYNIFAFVIYIVFIMIMPRLKSSLHPGNGGNPAFNMYEQDNIMRMFFYPAVIGWILFGFWIREIIHEISIRQERSV